MKQITQVEIEDFKTVLDTEIAVYSKMERCLEHKKQIIIQGDLDALVKMDTEIENLHEQAQSLEKERLAIMVKMGREGETLKEFIASLETGENSHILEQTRSRLIQSVEGIKKLSHTNQDLLTQSISFIEQSINVIASILAPDGPSYNNIRVGNKKMADHNSSGEGQIIPSTICRDA